MGVTSLHFLEPFYTIQTQTHQTFLGGVQDKYLKVLGMEVRHCHSSPFRQTGVQKQATLFMFKPPRKAVFRRTMKVCMGLASFLLLGYYKLLCPSTALCPPLSHFSFQLILLLCRIPMENSVRGVQDIFFAVYHKHKGLLNLDEPYTYICHGI